MISRRRMLLGGAAALAVGGSACSRKLRLEGAGASFPYPLYSRWIHEYQSVESQVRINYQSIGSGGGIRQILAKTVDFGASDAPVDPDEARAASVPLVHVPSTLGAVVIAFNVPGVTSLRLEPQTAADLFIGRVKRWNDPALARANPGVKLPDLPVRVVYRSDGSGTTAVVTDYLAKVGPDFGTVVGEGKSVRWPVGLGAKGNQGVAGQVRSTPGSIGYVELAYAAQSKLPFAILRNRRGEFVVPSPGSVSKAAAGVKLPASLHASITNSPGPGAYPIAAYSYLLVYSRMDDAKKGKALAEFIWWAVHEGQEFSEALHYARLPRGTVKAVEAALRGLQAGGQAVLPGA